MKTKLFLLLCLFCTVANAEHATEHGTPPSSLNSSQPSTAAQLLTLFDEFEQSGFLAVDDAFQLEIAVLDANHLATSFTIADGYYLYRDKIQFRSEPNLRLTTPVLPPGEMKTDAYFGKLAVYKQDFSTLIPFQPATPDARELTLHATYQGCAEDGICYAPVTKTFSLKLPRVISDSFAESGNQNKPAANYRVSSPLTPAVATTSLASLLGILLGAFLAGLLLTFTPCVLPMLPILSGIIAAQGKNTSTRQRTIRTLFYVLGCMSSYIAIGAFAGATGEQLQSYFQNVWTIGILCAVLVLMALSMFGLFTIQMPSFLHSALHNKAGRFSSSLPLIFLFGAMSAVIVGACVSPILISFLTLAIASGDAWLGAQIMFAMSLGMGVPLFALGMGAGHLIPKAGPWMETVKHIFGVLLIAVAIYLLGALPSVPVLLLWGAFLIIVSMYIRITSPNLWQRFVQGIRLVILLWGIAALIGGFFGERNLLKPLPQRWFSASDQLSAPLPKTQNAKLFTQVNNLEELAQQFAHAASENKLVMVEYYADWCVDCVRMEQTTFRDMRVRDTLQNHFVALKIDVTDPRNADGKALKKHFNIFGPPAVLFFNRDGNPIPSKHFYGYLNSAKFYSLITKLANTH